MPNFAHETRVLARIAGLVAGVDEAGRGPLAGPVVAAAVIFEKRRFPKGLDDSKKADGIGARKTLRAHHGKGHSRSASAKPAWTRLTW